eukprot:gene47848-64187_t
MWHRRLWLIDHGAALYFHHDWRTGLERAGSAFTLIKDHVLLKQASRVGEADARLAPLFTPAEIGRILALVPDAWLLADTAFADAQTHRAAYCEYFVRRLAAPRATYDYAIVRVVPRVERGEFINAGVILSCAASRYLNARIELDETALAALAPGVDATQIRASLASIPLICAGGPAAGALGALSLRERFHWLVAPRSSSVQTSPVHTGRCNDLAAALDGIFERMVQRRL